MDNSLKDLIEIIKTGSSKEVKEAQKEVGRFWHEFYIPKRKKGKKAFSVFLDEIKKFDQIQDIDHKVYLIYTLKWPLLAIGEEYFEEWAEFILRHIQDPSGKIRQAIISVADYLVMDIVIDLKFSFNKKVSKKEREKIENNRNRFCYFILTVEKLLSEYDEPRFNRYKYIRSMPPSVYKSLQKLIVEVLLRSDYHKKLYQKFLLSSNAENVSKVELVEKNLQELLNEYGLSRKLTLEMIRDWTWNDEGESAMDASNRFQKKWFKYFSDIKDIDEFNRILQVFVDAWNYFPHKSLEGRSPDQMVHRALEEDPSLSKKDDKEMPDVVVGDRKISWNEYWAMIAEMEKLQKPFKEFVEKEILPEYNKFLIDKFSPKTARKHVQIADIFFERAMHIGFIEFKDIRKDFVQKEFPKWWQTHILDSELNEKEVLSSLKELFNFLAFLYETDIEKFGF